MTLQRTTNPLPDGRYWVELSSPAREKFDSWRTANSGQVKVETTESDEEASPPWSFYIFNVKGMTPVPGGTGSIFIPITWPASDFGFPSLAPDTIKSREDVIQHPDLPKSGTDQLSDALGTGGLMGGLQSGLKIAGYGLGAYVLVKIFGALRGK